MKLLIAALLLIGCLVLYALNSMGGYQYYYGGSTVTEADVSEPVWSYGESVMSTTAPTWSYGESHVLDK